MGRLNEDRAGRGKGGVRRWQSHWDVALDGVRLFSFKNFK
jgi:hypothetical protein